jgi:hypothetical protein
MAYSDYGGYAYRNGVRVEERSDAQITDKGDTFGSPGMWPGFAAYAIGGKEEYEKRREWPSGHAILGDGPIYAVLYKQSYLMIHRGPERLEVVDLLKDAPPEAVSSYEHEGETTRYLNTDHFKETEDLAVFEVDGVRIEVYFREEDNHYMYVRLIQPDGVVWTGFSGYGVGAGLEDAGYGFSTEAREEMLQELFPAA